jgi:GT2 family glycosyltransferase
LAARATRLKVSIIIATHARPVSLARLLQGLAPQIDSAEHELIVADNGTPEPSPLPDLGVPIRRVHDPRPGKCRVQNRAVIRARGDVIVCRDDDLAVTPDYVPAVEGFFAQHPEFAAMKGRTLAAEDPIRKVGPLAVYLDLPIADHGESVTEVRGLLGANMAFRASTFAAVGRFDERLGPGACGHEEETEISARIRRAGLKIGYAPKATARHEVDPSRASRERFIRIARERGRCRVMHERHGAAGVALDAIVAAIRLGAARTFGAPLERIAREEKRLAIYRGMLDGLRSACHATEPSSASSPSP